jgi:CzcA family heavy metal efflux pump
LRWNKGVGISIGDLATVSYGSAPLIGGASIMGTPGVIVLVEGQYGSNTLAVTKALEDALSSLKPTLVAQDIVLWQDIFRPANFITQATRHLGLALLIGGVMVVSVLFLFLMNFRTAVISAIAIPLSLLAAVIILHALNITLNTMTLGGLAIALGEVVDDAIIDVENIYRRLRQNSQLAQPLSSFKVVLRASLEVRLAVVFATFIVVLVFLPVLKLSGVAGKLFAPLGVAYILAVLASLAIALTLTPALALALLSKNLTAAREPRWVGGMKARYIFLLSQVERHVKVVMVTVFILTLVALATLPFLRGSFIPELREGHFIVHLGLIPGTSLTETLEIGNRVSRAIMRIPGVHLVAQTVGRANEIVDPAGVQLGEIHVDLNPTNAAEQDEILRAIKSVLARFPGITSSVNTFLIERIDESISGVTAPVAIKIVGDDLDVIDQKAQEVARLVAAIPGAASVNIEAPPGTLELSIRLKHEQLQRWGFRPVEVLDAIQNAYQGAKVAQVFDGNRVYDVRVILAASVNANLSKVGELALRNPDGQAIQLQMLASIQQVVGRAQISHTDGQRLQTVSVRVGARALDAFVQDVRAQLAQHLQLPQGTYLVFSGESEARSQSRNDLLMYGALAFAGIFVLLCFAVNRRRSVVLILVNLPFALVGGVFSVAVTGCNLSLGAMVGFITLFGISLRNSIMLISHYEFLIYKDNLPWGLETAVRGASERLVPIVMTALITALALAPLAIMSGEPGNEIEGPMAIVILGGLISSTLLNLIVLPTLACRYGNFEQK